MARLPGEPHRYRLRTRLANGHDIEFDDPYRFRPLLSDFDLYLHGEGTHYESYGTLGAHLSPSARAWPACASPCGRPTPSVVSVAGDFNDWDSRRHPMRRRNGGVWEILPAGAGGGRDLQVLRALAFAGYQQIKADPYAFYCESAAEIRVGGVGPLDEYQWGDAAWMEAAREAATGCNRRSRSTRCTWNPGCAARGTSR